MLAVPPGSLIHSALARNGQGAVGFYPGPFHIPHLAAIGIFGRQDGFQPGNDLAAQFALYTGGFRRSLGRYAFFHMLIRRLGQNGLGLQDRMAYGAFFPFGQTVLGAVRLFGRQFYRGMRLFVVILGAILFPAAGAGIVDMAALGAGSFHRGLSHGVLMVFGIIVFEAHQRVFAQPQIGVAVFCPAFLFRFYKELHIPGAILENVFFQSGQRSRDLYPGDPAAAGKGFGLKSGGAADDLHFFDAVSPNAPALVRFGKGTDLALAGQDQQAFAFIKDPVDRAQIALRDLFDRFCLGLCLSLLRDGRFGLFRLDLLCQRHGRHQRAEHAQTQQSCQNAFLHYILLSCKPISGHAFPEGFFGCSHCSIEIRPSCKYFL